MRREHLFDLRLGCREEVLFSRNVLAASDHPVFFNVTQFCELPSVVLSIEFCLCFFIGELRVHHA